MGQSKAAQTLCAGAGRGIADGAGFVGAGQLKTEMEKWPIFSGVH